MKLPVPAEVWAKVFCSTRNMKVGPTLTLVTGNMKNLLSNYRTIRAFSGNFNGKSCGNAAATHMLTLMVSQRCGRLVCTLVTDHHTTSIPLNPSVFLFITKKQRNKGLFFTTTLSLFFSLPHHLENLEKVVVLINIEH